MHTGLYLISTEGLSFGIASTSLCQCPLGLIPHFYVLKEFASIVLFEEGVNALSGLYLISTHDPNILIEGKDKNTCQCPLGLIPHFYGTPSKA